MIGPLGRLGAAAILRQHCPQMTQRPGIFANKSLPSNILVPYDCGLRWSEPLFPNQSFSLDSTRLNVNVIEKKHISVF